MEGDFMRFTGLLKRALKDTSGATAIEYGLIVTFVALSIVAGARLMAAETNSPFETTSQALIDANS
jgi:Flp pilus assembly pilin Flp